MKDNFYDWKMNINMSKHISEEEITLQRQNQKDMQEALDREENSLETHFHQARRFPHYEIVKAIDSQGEWNQLWCIGDKRNKELPRELQGSFTDVQTAINAIQRYIKSEKEIH
jgi:hypothetical protein